MVKVIGQVLQRLCMALLVGNTALLHAQDANNILGLPAVPQGLADAA